MKKFMIVLVFLLLATTSFAGSVDFEWDPSPTVGVEFYTLHQIDPNGVDDIVADGILGLAHTLFWGSELGNYEYYVTANMFGEESIPSNIVTVHYGKPMPAGALRAHKRK
jgi:hypothetical protein